MSRGHRGSQRLVVGALNGAASGHTEPRIGGLQGGNAFGQLLVSSGRLRMRLWISRSIEAGDHVVAAWASCTASRLQQDATA